MPEIPYTKQKGCVKQAPWMNIKVGPLKFPARLDTGADITVVPGEALPYLEFNWDKSIRIRNAVDGISRQPTYRGTVTVLGRDFFIEKLLVAGRKEGLIGIDILKEFAVMFIGNVFILE